MGSSTCLLVAAAFLVVHSHPRNAWKPVTKEQEEPICGGFFENGTLSDATDRGIDARHVLWGEAGAGLVPYQFGVSLLDTDIPLFKEAMEYIESVSCVRFEERTGQETYLEFDRACDGDEMISSCGQCSCFSGSYVDSTKGLGEGGRVRLITGASLTAGNYKNRGHITHELLHALGHHHTQKRPDRDDYITIDYEKITKPYQYYMCSTCDAKGTPYDCMSIMHYRDWGFAATTGVPTMVAKDPETCDVKSTNRWLRWSDIDLLNINYQCQNPIPLVSGEGVLQSADSYPDSYPDRGAWVKYLVVAEGNTIEFTFVDEFEIESSTDCVYDYVAIVDGNGLDLLPHTCGTTRPSQTITSSTNRAYVEFVADYSTGGKGFKLQWREVGDATPAPTTTTTTTTTTPGAPTAPLTGSLTSGNYPNKYANRLDETYTIEVEEGRKIGIEFTTFKIQKTKKCKADWLMIVDGNGEVLMEKSCGYHIPIVEIVSSTNKVNVIFHTNKKRNAPGWALTWTSLDASPEPNLISSPNYPENYENDLEETYEITAPGEDDILEISFAHFDLEYEEDCEYDSLMIKDGDGTVLMDKTCGSEIPSPVQSSTNRVNVIFSTDSSETATGFQLEWRVAIL